MLVYDRRVSLLKLATWMRRGRALSPPTVYGHQFVRSLPVCNVQTNLSASAVPSDFTQRLSKVLASTLNKPEDVSGAWLVPSLINGPFWVFYSQ